MKIPFPEGQAEWIGLLLLLCILTVFGGLVAAAWIWLPVVFAIIATAVLVLGLITFFMWVKP